MILYLPFLKNEAFPRIPSQRVLTAYQPDAGPDPSPCQLGATGRLSSPERGLVFRKEEMWLQEQQRLFVGCSHILHPKGCCGAGCRLSSCLPSLRGTYVTVHTDSRSFAGSCLTLHACYMLQYHSFTGLNKCNASLYH